MKYFTATRLLCSMAMLASITPLHASDTQDENSLHNTIHQLDAELFDAFNQCKDPTQLEKHAAFFSPDTEFYHDYGGVTWTREAMIANTKKNVCGNYTRKLLEDTFQVSPIKDFGAIATGVHQFCQTATKQCDGEADFMMIWRHNNGKWEVTRTISYGHRAAPKK